MLEGHCLGVGGRYVGDVDVVGLIPAFAPPRGFLVTLGRSLWVCRPLGIDGEVEFDSMPLLDPLPGVGFVVQ